jgi:hypothetical protein
MKKVILTVALFIGSIQFSNAQIDYGIKGGLNFASPSDAVSINLSGDVETKQSVDANTSWHAGAWLRVKVPIVGLYVRPEIVYTSITTSLPIPGGFANLADDFIQTEYKVNRIDFPILVGLKMFGIGNVFAGPVFEYVTKSDIDGTDQDLDVTSLDSDDFFVGMQVGIGLEFWKLGIDIRYETAFSDNVTAFEAPEASDLLDFELDNSPDQFILGLSYKF